MISRLLSSGSIVLSLSCGEPQASRQGDPAAGALRSPVSLALPVMTAAAIELGVTPLALDDSGAPRLLRGSDQTRVVAAADATTAARLHVQRLAPAWGVAANAVPVLEALGEVPVAGGTIVRLRQVIDGLPVDRGSGGELRVMVDRDGALIAASGTLLSLDTPRDRAVRFIDDDAGAVARAVGALYRGKFAPGALAARSAMADGTRLLAGGDGAIRVSLSRAQQAWHFDGKTLTAAWIVEAYSSDKAATGGDAVRTAIAADGRVLARTDLQADAEFRYRVFADTTDERHPLDGPIVDPSPHATGAPDTVPYPAYVEPNLVAVDGLNHRAGSPGPDPWLAAGSTETVGNNVDAYVDLSAPDGLSNGDFRASVTSPGAFDRSYDTSLGALATQSQQMAGTTSLFYLINWLHDFWYDAGFSEVAGNAQGSNLSRGGVEGDPIHAEAQDNALGGSRNNANMATPDDGLSPRMQVFIWNGIEERTLTVSGRRPSTGAAAFGPSSFDASARVVLANDGSGATTDACQPLVAPVTGMIVLVDRGICSFKAKALAVQNAGGVGMILADNAVDDVPPELVEDTRITTPITIGSLSVLLSEGTDIKSELAQGQVHATVHRKVDPELDGSLDASVVGHEFGHYLHHRLSACRTALCDAMSEGWGDFSALLLMARDGDDLDGAFPIGVYSTRSFPADPGYFGIRRAPYSVTPSINALAFHHMADGAALPSTHPVLELGPNSEVHNAGEIWASMLWEGYVALQRAGRSFDAVRLAMRRYVVAALLLAPPDATPTEMRDAMLIVVNSNSPAEHDVLAAAFARRGFGTCAVSPPRGSEDFTGIVDSTVVRGRIAPGAVTAVLTKQCDDDGVLDAGETMRLTAAITNTGPSPLVGLAATLRSTAPGVRILASSVALGDLAAYGNATATFEIEIADSLTTVALGQFAVDLTSGNTCGATAPVEFTMLLNADDQPASSATDTLDALGSVWVPAGDASLWTHKRRTPLDGFWAGADAPFTANAILESPPLTGRAGVDVSVTFSHRFSFEFYPPSGPFPAQACDGGVVEYTTDDGATWFDAEPFATTQSRYNQVLSDVCDANQTNPLTNRRAYGGTSRNYPATTMVTLQFRRLFERKTFKLRFRTGSDSSIGAPGWEIDSLAFTGIDGTPFPRLVPDNGICLPPPVDAGVPDAAVSPEAGPPVDAEPPADGMTPVDADVLDDAELPEPSPDAPKGDAPLNPAAGEAGGCSAGGDAGWAGAALGLLLVRRGRRRG